MLGQVPIEGAVPYQYCWSRCIAVRCADVKMQTGKTGGRKGQACCGVVEESGLAQDIVEAVMGPAGLAAAYVPRTGEIAVLFVTILEDEVITV